MKKAVIAYLHTFFGKDLELRVRLFHVLAITGVIICVIMTCVSVAGGMWVSTAINAGAGLISLFLLLYSAKTRRYQFCYYMTIVVIFFILFPSLFFSGGGYKGGMPFFFVFAAVFTVYMLDGWPMAAVTAAELIFYAALCELARIHPDLVIPFKTEQAVVVDVIIGLITVSISLGATMFVQVRMYRRQQQELEQANRKAKEASRAKSIFLASMSHEIRTPIHMILGMNEIIHRESRSAQVRDYSEKISDTSKMLLSLVDSVLDVSKIESGKMELIPASYESANLVRTLILIGRSNCKGKNLRFQTEISRELPRQLYGDLTHIRQIASNLLSNAAKYTEKGSVTLKIFTQPLAGENRTMLCISIRDTGIGIASEALPTLFDAFARADLAAHRNIIGTGLGLKIVKELTDLMGGTVSVESTPGEGSTFLVRLPQTIVQEQTGQAGAKDVTFVAPGVRILAVDDNEANCSLLQELLRPTQMTVDTACCGSDCLRLVQEQSYDLILMDYMMPQMDGLETLKQLQKLPDFHIPVIALTADATAETKQRLMGCGFSAYLTKPIPWPGLRDGLLALLPEELVMLCREEHPNDGMADEALEEKLKEYGVIAREAMPYFENSLSQYAAVAAVFLRHDPAEQEKAERLWQDGDLENLRFPIHALKGKARNVGLLRLGDVCAYVEGLCRNGQADEVDSLMPYLLFLWRRGCRGLELVVKAGEQPSGDVPAVPAVADATGQLRSCLQAYQRKPSLELIRGLMTKETEQKGRQMLEKINALTESFSFDQAEKALDAYLTWKKEGV